MIIKRLYILAGCTILAACGGDNSSETSVNNVVPPEARPVVASRVVFQPADGVLPLPSDLLFSGTTDGTLEPPDEADAKADEDQTVNLANPAVALGGLDGWSTQMPMRVSIATTEGARVDASSVGAASVLMVQTDCGLGGRGCSSFTPLTYGVDYVAVAGADTVSVVPLKPLAAKTNYIVAFTNGLADSQGSAIAASELYEQLTSDISIDNEGLAGLRAAINGYQNIVAGATGTAPADIIFTNSWTTTSAGDVSIATARAITARLAPSVSGIAPHPVFSTTADLGGQGIADVYQGSITLPYFLADSTAEAPRAALTERFTALCDNGVLLSQADPDVLATLTPGPNAAACAALELGDFGLDSERYVTRYNPVAEARSIKNLEVILTVPNARSGQNGPFPLVMYQHGITRNKETILAIADSLAAAGLAVIAIDLPLHGSRGFDVDGDGEDDINASDNVVHYMNLQYLLTGKDNLRQSFLDMLGLRMAIQNGFSFADSASISDADFDRSSLKFVGTSLGGITGTAFTALAAALEMPVESAAFVVPGGGIVPLLLDSGDFGRLVRSSVLEAAELDPATVDAATAASVLGMFAFAAQTIIEGVDPNNYAATVAATTPAYMAQVNGDQTIPNRSSFGGLSFGGTEPLANFMGLSQVSFGDEPAARGFVKFTEGYHGTFLDPSQSPQASATATAEMQTQVATFLASGSIAVTDAGVVE